MISAKKVFLFDLDSTITREEILPTIAKEIGKEEEMRFLTESTMLGEIDFENSFRARVDLLKSVSVKKVAEMVSQIRLNEKLVDFIRKNKEVCYIVTGNLDVWIVELIKRIGLDEERVFCSHANVQDDEIKDILYVMKKEDAIEEFDSDAEIIAVGDGSNDYELVKKANVGIGFGGVRRVAPNLLEVCDYAVFSEEKLCELLERIENDN